MIHFEWPWFALLSLLPILVRYLLKPTLRHERVALHVPFVSDFICPERGGPAQPPVGRPWLLWLAALAWLLFILALMRPQWLGELVTVPVTGRDLMLAVDLSGSMQERDFMIRQQRVDRLTATKWVAGQFITQRVGDRIGLILFGEQAYLQAPLTFDRETVRFFLDESFIGLAGEKTAIGDAIGLAVKRLRERDEKNRVLILLTDGADSASSVEPLAAADIAADEGLKIYTIGIGADEMQVRGFFGMDIINPAADLDEKTLEAIAAKTGGRYFRARDTKQLHNIYKLLDQLEPVIADPLQLRPYTALYYWPLSGALMLVALLVFLRLHV